MACDAHMHCLQFLAPACCCMSACMLLQKLEAPTRPLAPRPLDDEERLRTIDVLGCLTCSREDPQRNVLSSIVRTALSMRLSLVQAGVQDASAACLMRPPCMFSQMQIHPCMCCADHVCFTASRLTIIY